MASLSQARRSTIGELSIRCPSNRILLKDVVGANCIRLRIIVNLRFLKSTWASIGMSRTIPYWQMTTWGAGICKSAERPGLYRLSSAEIPRYFSQHISNKDVASRHVWSVSAVWSYLTKPTLPLRQNAHFVLEISLAAYASLYPLLDISLAWPYCVRILGWYRQGRWSAVVSFDNLWVP